MLSIKLDRRSGKIALYESRITRNFFFSNENDREVAEFSDFETKVRNNYKPCPSEGLTIYSEIKDDIFILFLKKRVFGWGCLVHLYRFVLSY